MLMALIDYTRQVNFSPSVENLLGVEVRHYGQNQMTRKEKQDFESTLGSLKKDYPDIFKTMSHIELIHDNEAARFTLSSRFFLGEQNRRTTGVTIPGENVGSHISLSMQNFHGVNERGGLRPGAGVGITQRNPFMNISDLLNHEFGHAIHNHLARPTSTSTANFDEFLQRRERLIGNFASQAAKNNLSAQTLESARAAANSQELFAESFARARSGTGPGLPQAQAFEKSLKSSIEMSRPKMIIKEVSSSEKMASNTRNAFKALRAMGSNLR